MLRLNERMPRAAHPGAGQLASISSPLTSHAPAWRSLLAAHPDSDFATYIISGIEHGFWVGFDYACPLSSVKRNMAHPAMIEQYLCRERAAGRILGPINPGEVPNLHISRFAVMPKGRSSGRWHLITDLSWGGGGRINGSDQFSTRGAPPILISVPCP